MDHLLNLPILRKMQRRHFWRWDIGPLFVSLISIPVIFFFGLTGWDWFLFVIMWFLTEVGLELGMHRYFSHRSFETSPIFKKVLAVLASMNGQGQIVSWVSNHRFHHQVSDTDQDPHSPHKYPEKSVFRKFWFSQLLWKWEYDYADPTHFAPDIMKDKALYRVSRHYEKWILFGVLAPGLVVFAFTLSWERALVATLFAGVIRLSFCQHSTFLVNSACHLWGRQNYVSGSAGKSRNLTWLSLFTLGGALHNNHHSFPQSANNAHRPGEFDPGYWVILILEKWGWIWNVKRSHDGEFKES